MDRSEDHLEIWILWYVPRDGDATSEPLLIGVYSSEEEVQRAVARLEALPGFRDDPQLTDDLGVPGFYAAPYTVNEDSWTSGFIDGDLVNLVMEGEAEESRGHDEESDAEAGRS
jgi:hypothetical protein